MIHPEPHQHCDVSFDWSRRNSTCFIRRTLWKFEKKVFCGNLKCRQFPSVFFLSIWHRERYNRPVEMKQLQERRISTECLKQFNFVVIDNFVFLFCWGAFHNSTNALGIQAQTIMRHMCLMGFVEGLIQGRASREENLHGGCTLNVFTASHVSLSREHPLHNFLHNTYGILSHTLYHLAYKMRYIQMCTWKKEDNQTVNKNGSLWFSRARWIFAFK